MDTSIKDHLHSSLFIDLRIFFLATNLINAEHSIAGI